ncbi:MAG TPA: DNA mismatch repair endonuclease MutL [Patescibacteria group bacterium]|nr:DNA mismatch repair endonuclease MutL [Patescibacteria group bacterium]
MGKIHLLPPEIVAKIAAGEVIERPAYVVKELIENSLDASATRIEIHLQDSGLRKIIVHDNGSGMSKEDLLESFKLHTTSKVSQEQQLLSIASLGFRGEALASITAVSDITLQSRTANEPIGTLIALKSGKIIEESTAGMPVGTSISVHNLFKSAPGRKKFLKSKQTELRHIIEQIIYQAAAHPEIAFLVTHNGKRIMDLAVLEQKPRLSLLFSRLIQDKFVAISFKDAYVEVQGFVTPPQLSFPITSKQHLFINCRHVADNQLARLVKQAFGTSLSGNRYPAFCIFIQLPFEFVDVNVHPRKEQVSITNKEQVMSALSQAIKSALSRQEPDFSSSGLFPLSQEDITHSFAGLTLRETVNPWLVRDSEQKINNFEPTQLHNLYIVMPNKYGFVLIDQHAAHERILYEQYMSAFTKRMQKSEFIFLEEEKILDLTLGEKNLLEEREHILNSIGFKFKKKDDEYIVLAIPKMFTKRNIEELIKELLENMKNIVILNSFQDPKKMPKPVRHDEIFVDSQSQKMLAFLACRQAIMAGDKLSNEEMKRLIEQLAKTENNSTCPHGRPTKIQVTIEELNKVFKRK